MNGDCAVNQSAFTCSLKAAAPALTLALTVALAGCSESPATLRIVSGPPLANEQVAALLVSVSAEVATPVRLTLGTSVAGAEAALAALDEGRAELAIVENSASYRHAAVRTVAPLYPSVLHIGVRPEKRGQALAQVLDGARVFAGDEQTAGRQLLKGMASMYAWSGVEFSFVNALEDDPDVVFVFAPISPSAAPILDGYELLSLGSAADVGSGSAADALSLVAPFLRAFVIPEGTYGLLTPTSVATVALDTLLVTREDTSIVVVYDLVQSVQVMGPLLVAQRPDLAIDELETFEISHVTFPVHAGTLALRARNDPGFAERASSILETAITVLVALFTTLFALLRFLRGLRKGRIDRFYSSALEVRSKLANERSAQRRRAYVTELRALRADAFSLLIKEKLAPDDSFRILQALIYDVIREAETPFAEPVAAPDPAR
jgi:TRAP-type uncharacterized transport system substrate-binding protein